MAGKMYSFSPEFRMERTIDVHCICGAYLGKVVPGYTMTIQCYCGEVMSVPKPGAKELMEPDQNMAVALVS